MVGGGIAGLAAAWELAGSDDVEVTVYEPERLGGKLKTTEFCGRAVDEGPDAFLTRSPDGLELCRELGLDGELTAPVARRALLLRRGRLRPLPEGLVLGAPARLLPLARSGVLSVAGMARALLDLVLPATAPSDDVGVFQLVSARFGSQVAERLVEPLLGSIHAGTSHGLSAAATAPQLLAANRSGRSLLLALSRVAASQAAAARAMGGDGEAPLPVFMAPRSGMEALVRQLEDQLGKANTTFVPAAVTRLVAQAHGIVVEPGGQLYEGVVVAVPGAAAVPLLEGLGAAGAVAPLAQLRYASVAVATMAVPAQQVPVSPDVSGILVAPGGSMLMTACSFGSHKWPHWASPGTEVLRVSVGKANDERWAALDDAALVERLCAELSQAFARQGRRSRRQPLSPEAWRVSRWPASFPQYTVGHLQRVAQAKAALAQATPRVALAGAPYEGSGVPACIASGRRAATAVIAAAGGGAASAP